MPNLSDFEKKYVYQDQGLNFIYQIAQFVIHQTK